MTAAQIPWLFGAVMFAFGAFVVIDGGQIPTRDGSGPITRQKNPITFWLIFGFLCLGVVIFVVTAFSSK